MSLSNFSNRLSISKLGIRSLKIRWVLTCDTEDGICSVCYGRDLARGTPVNIGEAVGVVAAQSIGEPGTQLTMRTFHIGGAASRSVAANSIEVKTSGGVKYHNLNVCNTWIIENLYNDSGATPIRSFLLLRKSTKHRNATLSKAKQRKAK